MLEDLPLSGWHQTWIGLRESNDAFACLPSLPAYEYIYPVAATAGILHCHQNPASSAFEHKLKARGFPRILQGFITRLQLLRHPSLCTEQAPGAQPLQCTSGHCWTTRLNSCKPIYKLPFTTHTHSASSLPLETWRAQNNKFAGGGEYLCQLLIG